MNDTTFIIEMSIWGAYFGIGLLLLILLVWTRATLRTRDKERAKVDQTMYRHHMGKNPPTSTYGSRRVI
jgi:hypothetical protein